MAGIGASFFLAFVIEATWMVTRPALREPWSRAEAEAVIGFFTGIAVAGLVAVVIALVLSETQGSDWTWKVDYLVWWSAVALFSLGFLVAMQPMLAHTWQAPGEETGDKSED